MLSCRSFTDSLTWIQDSESELCLLLVIEACSRTNREEVVLIFEIDFIVERLEVVRLESEGSVLAVPLPYNCPSEPIIDHVGVVYDAA